LVLLSWYRGHDHLIVYTPSWSPIIKLVPCEQLNKRIEKMIRYKNKFEHEFEITKRNEYQFKWTASLSISHVMFIRGLLVTCLCSFVGRVKVWFGFKLESKSVGDNNNNEIKVNSWCSHLGWMSRRSVQTAVHIQQLRLPTCWYSLQTDVVKLK